MAERSELASEIRNLNKEYLRFNPPNQPMPSNADESDKQQKALVNGAQLVADFYPQKFLPKYNSSVDSAIQEAGFELECVGKIASRLIREKNYFGLGVLLYSKGSRDNDTNYLEEIASKLDK